MDTIQEQARRIADLHVLWGQGRVIDELIQAGRMDEDYTYPFLDSDDEIFEWWLVDSWLAERLKREGEVIIDSLGCFWWGRQSSGQAIYMDDVIQRIAEVWNAGRISSYINYKLLKLGDLQFDDESATPDFQFAADENSIIKCNI